MVMHACLASLLWLYFWRVYATVGMKSMVVGRVWRDVVLQGTLYIKKCMGGIRVVASSVWSLNKSGCMKKFDCIAKLPKKSPPLDKCFNVTK